MSAQNTRTILLFVCLSFVGYCLIGIEGINKTLVVRIARISEKMGVVTN